MRQTILCVLLLGSIHGCAYERESYGYGTVTVNEDGTETRKMQRDSKCTAGLLVPMIPVPCSWVADDEDLKPGLD